MVCSKCTLRGHVSTNCRTKCHKCKFVGHFKKNCRSKRNYSHQLEDVEDPDFVSSEGNMDNWPLAMHQTEIVSTAVAESGNVSNYSLKSKTVEYDNIQICDNLHGESLGDNQIEFDDQNDDQIEFDDQDEIKIEHNDFDFNKPDLIVNFVESRPNVNVKLNKQYTLPMEFDSGSTVSVCSVSSLHNIGVPSYFLNSLVSTSKALKVANKLN